MPVEIIKASVEIVKALAWPAAILLILRGYKPDLSQLFQALLKGKVEVAVGGVRASVDLVGQNEATNFSSKPLAGSESIASPPATAISAPRPAVDLIENRLRSELQKVDADKREEVLVHALALTRLQGSHEFTYNRIFGSQILGLRRLNEAGQVTIDDARNFFRPYAEQFRQIYDSYGFDGWLGFLLKNDLVIQEGEVLKISEVGRDFLTYLVNAPLSDAKPW